MPFGAFQIGGGVGVEEPDLRVLQNVELANETNLAALQAKDASVTLNDVLYTFDTAGAASYLVRPFDQFDGSDNEGTTLPDATTTTYKHFLLHSQTDLANNGWYRLVGATHWVQVTSGVSAADQTYGFGDTLPDPATTTTKIFFLTSGAFAGSYERIGNTHWAQFAG